jgi:hypothetical protein
MQYGDPLLLSTLPTCLSQHVSIARSVEKGACLTEEEYVVTELSVCFRKSFDHYFGQRVLALHNVAREWYFNADG